MKKISSEQKNDDLHPIRRKLNKDELKEPSTTNIEKNSVTEITILDSDDEEEVNSNTIQSINFTKNSSQEFKSQGCKCAKEFAAERTEKAVYINDSVCNNETM